MYVVGVYEHVATSFLCIKLYWYNCFTDLKISFCCNLSFKIDISHTGSTKKILPSKCLKKEKSTDILKCLNAYESYFFAF